MDKLAFDLTLRSVTHPLSPGKNSVEHQACPLHSPRRGRIAAAHVPSTLFEEIATMFASALSAKAILDFSPSPSAVDRASELLELNRVNGLDEASRAELDQYEQGELLMRLVKARIRANQSKDMPDDE